VTDTSEQTAEQIAARGREALIARLRPAFEEAAAAHSDVLQLGPEQIETMVQRAADRADGLQWRRALASVATEELGISLGEALSHPAVARAHELVGAPSYEDSLAELGPATPRSGGVQTKAPELPAEPEPAAEAASAEPAEHGPEQASVAIEVDEPSPEGAETETEQGDEQPEPGTHEYHDPDLDEEDEDEAHEHADDDDPEGAANADVEHDEEDHERALDGAHAIGDPGTAEYELEDLEEYYDDDEGLRVSVVHLGGIANLAPSETDIELLMSVEGLDIIRGSSDVLGRLEWDQVKALEVPLARGRRRMRKPGPTHLVVRTQRGDASFEVPEVTPEELLQHLAPVIAEHIPRP
jgi:hypothetical protein